MKPALLVCLLLFSSRSFELRAQTKRIHIVGNDSLPIAYCTIVNLTYNSVLLADNNGFINISPYWQNDTILFRSVGYHDSIIVYRSDISNVIVLQRKHFDIKEVSRRSKSFTDTVIGDNSKRKLIPWRVNVGGQYAIRYELNSKEFKLKGFALYVANYTHPNIKAKVEIYPSDSSGFPDVSRNLLDTALIISFNKKNSWYRIDSLDKWVTLPGRTFFVILHTLADSIPICTETAYVELGHSKRNVYKTISNRFLYKLNYEGAEPICLLKLNHWYWRGNYHLKLPLYIKK